MTESSISIRLSDSEFLLLKDLVYSQCGIHLSASKKILLESRLQRRLSLLGLGSFSQYYDFVTGPRGQEGEIVSMIDAVTTNKTDFYREPVHFEFMRTDVLHSVRKDKPLKIWSAACSTGEEPYSISMCLEEFNLKVPLQYHITATDISTKVLQYAMQAIYPERLIEPVPVAERKRYMLKSKDAHNKVVRLTPQIRSKVTFRRLNLMDDVYDLERDFDIVFCRNVLIYFDRKTQEEVVKKLLHQMKPGGYLFIGHSESIYQMNLPVQQLRPTIFQKM